MKEQQKRIAAFIESLPMCTSNVQGQSVVLSADIESVGGDNAKNCVNNGNCGYVLNGGDCRNYDSTGCAHSTNKGSCGSWVRTDKCPISNSSQSC